MADDPIEDPPSRVKQEPRMVTYIISPPVRAEMNRARQQSPILRVPVIICPAESRDEPQKGIGPNKAAIKALLEKDKDARVRDSDCYVFASLLPDQIDALVDNRAVWNVWLDHQTRAHLLSSAETVKASACWRTFDARGSGVTWAVLDSGIKSTHPHFRQFDTVDLSLSANFSTSVSLDDVYGHGTHVAGIIAGTPATDPSRKYRAATFLEDDTEPQIHDMDRVPSGIAPLAKLVNVKVLGDDGTGSTSAAILGLEHLRKINQASRTIRIDGANMSLGYPFDPVWYGCGHSPLCEEVLRTVDAGIVVVVSSGNSGYGLARAADGTDVPVYYELSINDPGNAESAITVGSVHKSSPHTYGVSYFSSKGPTGDGRLKPDLVAPGEKIVSCSIRFDDHSPDTQRDYEEMSGTSMSAPHVSGAIAAFLSVHREFRGRPADIKEILLKTATDLRRDRSFQGAGLVDILRAITSV